MSQALLRQLEQNEWIAPGTRLLVGLSGGVDSVVLLHLLKQLSPLRGFTLAAAHLDHAIRPESAEDALVVEGLCRNWDVPLTTERCDVLSLAKAGKLSIEMAAREARREFLRRTAAEQDMDFIVLAHHRDDQAETFLLRLLRGTGFSGLAGMLPCHGQWLRPLLHISREQVLKYARQQNLEWREDSSNLDSRYLRNKIRHHLLPQLREYNPRLEERFDLLCRQQQAEEDYWLQSVQQALPELILSREGGLRLCRSGLLALHPALRVRLLREAIRSQRGNLQSLAEVHLVAIEQMLQGDQSQAALDLPGLWVARRYDQLWLRSSPPQTEGFSLSLEVPGEISLPEGSYLRAEFDTIVQGEAENVVEFEADSLSYPLQIRTFLNGDRFSPCGAGGSKKLKDFFIDIKLEKEQRSQVPLVISGEQILWVAGVRRSAFAPAEKKSEKILRLKLERQ